MKQEYSENNNYAPVNSDEDDEFGGAKLTLDLFHRTRKANNKTTKVEKTLNNECDQDDEFGGVKLTPAMIYGKDKYPAVTAKIDEDGESDDVLTPEKKKMRNRFSLADIIYSQISSQQTNGT